MTDELVRLGAARVVDLLLAGELRPEEVVEAAIARIEAVDSIVNALPARCFDRAREQARALGRSNARGVLGGLPIVVKDNNDVGGVPTTGGTAIFRDRVPPVSDRTIAQLERQGAIPLAKSNLSELGGANTTNRLFGTTLHPMDPRLTCGGSSGGSAVAVATGQVWVAHGNDVGGSLRIPPAFCGVAGLRPTPGRIPRKALAEPFDTIMVDGPIARSVEDLALLFDAMVAHDPGDPLSAPSPDAPFRPAARAPQRPAGRIALCAAPGGLPVEREIRDAFEGLARRLAAAGADTVAAQPACEGAHDAIAALRGDAYATTWEAMLGRLPADAFTAQVRGDIVRGLTQEPAALRASRRWRDELARGVARFWDTHEFFLCPATQAMPFPAEQMHPATIDGVPSASYFHWFTIAYVWSLVGCPVLALPLGRGASGLPIGVQIMGPPRSEAQLLAFGAWWEREICPPAEVIDPPRA
jgi:amidase